MLVSVDSRNAPCTCIPGGGLATGLTQGEITLHDGGRGGPRPMIETLHESIKKQPPIQQGHTDLRFDLELGILALAHLAGLQDSCLGLGNLRILSSNLTYNTQETTKTIEKVYKINYPSVTPIRG